MAVPAWRTRVRGQLTDPATRSTPAMLSIDSRVQAAMESELYAAMIPFKAKGATGLVLDVDTGEVIAMASLPVYNPNKFGTSLTRRCATT
jgi:cell division protein FtsI (penicillin-binding protein 3)